MSNDFIIRGLNPAQTQAVLAPEPHVLVLAGAGSGKTRVLISRIAHWIANGQARSDQIVALTFTNKAAGEMRSRLNRWRLETAGAWLGTFHSWGYHFLRKHAHAAALDDRFMVLDAEDQMKLMKQVIKDLGEEVAQAVEPKDAVMWVNHQKEKGLRPEHVRAKKTEDVWLKTVYERYTEVCEQQGKVDFAELLLRPFETLQKNSALLKQIQDQTRFWLVDEFQDTSDLQYRFLLMLVGDHGKSFVVGDDGQSIYGWRQARVENLIDYTHQFPQCAIYKLEQNYRSGGHILEAANRLLARNPQEAAFKKNLWTDKGLGKKPTYTSYQNDIDEAQGVIRGILDARRDGLVDRWADCAVLYRMNALSRVLEEQLIAAKIPYVIYGGMKFFERQEVKDALAYARWMLLPTDRQAWERILSRPSRGIGDKTQAVILNSMGAEGDLWQAMLHCAADKRMGKTQKTIQALMDQMETWKNALSHPTPPDLDAWMRTVVEESGLWKWYQDLQQKDSDDTNDRMENLRQLFEAMKQYQQRQGLNGWLGMREFLAYAAMEADPLTHQDDAVQLMSLHAAKGLEFKWVALVAWEQGVFPAAKSIEDPSRLCEERRLAYVGITRAEEFLWISSAKQRLIYGGRIDTLPSQFIHEIPADHLSMVNAPKKPYSPRLPLSTSIADAPLPHYTGGANVAKPSTHSGADPLGHDHRPTVSTAHKPSAGFAGEWRPGMKVRHADFGEGITIQEMARGFWKIAFMGAGLLTVSVKDAKLSVLGAAR